MPSNRRRGTRNRFEFNKNYIIPLICIIITCVSVITCTLIVINVKEEVKTINVNSNSLSQTIEKISDDQTIQINSLISFIMSNLESGQTLNDNLAKFNLVCKYYGISNEYSFISDDYVDKIDPELYRELNYVYFDDYKEKYKYISKSDFENTYKKLFSQQSLDLSNYSKYYITSLDGYLVSKNTEVYENIAYKLDKIQKNNDNKYIANFTEVNMYKLYEQKSIEEINNYLSSSIVENDYKAGNVLNINLNLQENIFVFDSYL